MSYIEWLRRRVGNRKIFLVFGTVVLQDENGRILLQRRSDFNFWGLPGGVMELGEDIETCARRELLEETGLMAGPLRLVGVYTDPQYEVTYPNGDEVQQFTVCLTSQMAGGVMRPDGTETTEQGFFTPDEVAAMDLPPWYAAMVHDTLAGGEPTFASPFAADVTMDQIRAVRPFIGHARLIAVGAAALVMREDSRILAVQRQDNGAWVFPSGYCDLGENVAQTAVRETQEETGLEIVLERLLGVYSGALFYHTYPNGDQVQDVGVVFRARCVGGTLKLDKTEVSHTAWFTPAELLANVPSERRLLFESALEVLDEGTFVC